MAEAWINAVLAKLNAPVTPRNRAYMGAWGRAEGGFTHNTARFNWLNTSRQGYGGVSAGISGVPHIKAYPTFDAGTQATADTIKWGYPSILAGLRAGGPKFNPGVASDLNKWVSGSRSTAMSKYVRGIASMTGDAPAGGPMTGPAGTRGGPAPVSIEVPGAPQVKTVTRPRISQQALISSLLKAATTGNYTGALLNLAAFNTPIKEQKLVYPKGDVIKPTLTPGTARGTKLNPAVDVDHGDQISDLAAPTIRLAKQYLGTPYRWGGASPRTGFDCSGFVQWLYGQRGIETGRTTWDQVKRGTPVDRSQLQPGDAVFFNTESTNSHEGMYIGGGQFIHSPHTGDVIKISSLNDPYYNAHYNTARRYL